MPEGWEIIFRPLADKDLSGFQFTPYLSHLMKSLLLALTLLMVKLANADDMQTYLKTTQDLVGEGKHEEALKRFMWFHEHALEHDPAMYGVRLSFALSYWKILGDAYPPARTALVKLRDDSEKILRDGKKDRRLFHDFVALNRTLDDQDKTVKLFDSISSRDPAEAKIYWDSAQEVILDEKRFDLAEKYMKDIEGEFVEVKQSYDRNLRFYEDPNIGNEHFKTYNQNSFIKESLKLIEFALATNKRDAAVSVRDKALKVLDDQRLRDAIPQI